MRARREGFTVVELLLVLVLGLTVLGGAYTTLVRQEQAYGRLRARAATGEDARTGLDFLTAELREISPAGGDLVVATPDSIRFRALRKFGMVCETRKFNSVLVLAQVGVDPFAAEDSLMVYADGDSLLIADDSWKPAYVKSATLGATCDPISSTLALSLATLLPGATLNAVQLQGAGLKFDSIFAGAPVRSFEVLTYGTGLLNGQRMLTRRDKDGRSPLLGPLVASGGLRFRYFDLAGTELTSFPLDDTDRARVRRVRVEIRAERQGSAGVPIQSDMVTDVFTRGS